MLRQLGLAYVLLEAAVCPKSTAAWALDRRSSSGGSYASNNHLQSGIANVSIADYGGIPGAENLSIAAYVKLPLRTGFVAVGASQRAHNQSKSSAGLALAIIVGGLLMFIAVPIQWFNEERSARMETLLARGAEEVISVDSKHMSKSNRGRLIHVQGRAAGAVELADERFPDAIVRRCIKLQSTVEVFEWVQTTRAWQEAKERRSLPRFHMEWCTSHHDSARFRKPSPDNPRPPMGLLLGTFTRNCDVVQLGLFVLSEEMLKTFHRFEPAMKLLPQRVEAQGLTFFANPRDGYYYARPGLRSFDSEALFADHQVGDLRVRFMCVPETDATVVAVQSHRDDRETFIPYRAVRRNPCVEEWQARQTLIEEGDKSLRELRSETSCGTGVASCCCCACNTIACLCAQEVVTEEICYVSDRLEPADKPFQGVVHRNPCRVWNFRLLGVALMFLGIHVVLHPFSNRITGAKGLEAYGSAATLVLAFVLSVVGSAVTAAAAAAPYRPLIALRWLVAAGVFAFTSLLVGGRH